MAEAAKFIDRAEKLLEKGKPELALAEFRTALELEPQNEALLHKTADLSMSLGQLGVASDMLRRLFSRAVDGKKLGEAALVFRKLQRLKALDPEMVVRYADLCENTSRRDAGEAYRIAFEEFQRLGDGRRALECIGRALELDPRMDDFREQARIAEALHEPKLAATALVRLAVMLERLAQDAGPIYERAFGDDPDNMAARLGWGRALLAGGRAAEAVNLLHPLASYPSSPDEAREPYALALLALGRVEDAEPYAWGLFERNPRENLYTLHTVIGGLLDLNRDERALELARKLEDHMRKAGMRIQFMQDMAQLADQRKTSIPFLEYLAEIYNSANRELDYAQILGRLFDAYMDAGQYTRALDALDRSVDIDPYEAEHKVRMNKLAGHVPEERLQVVARRLGVAPPEAITVAADDSVEENPAPKVLENLILQAEIFLQYDMKDKAMQQIEQIQRGFSGEIENDPRVRQLFMNAGLPVPEMAETTVERNRMADSMVRAAEVSRLIARQTDPHNVLVTAVNQIGTRWQYSRCLAALATPGKPPSMVVEYCSPEVAKSERTAMVRLLALSQRLTLTEPVFRAADVNMSEALAPIKPELARLNIHSLAVLAMVSEDKPIGLLMVQQCGVRRRWTQDDMALLRSLADQMAMAVHGARLRSLVSTLGVAEETTGLLKRSAYLAAVVSELSRQKETGDAGGTLALLQVSMLTSQSDDEFAIAEMVRTLRSMAQDDAMSFRYDRDTVALLLPKVPSAQVEVLVEKLREAVDAIGVTITAGIAQAAPISGYEPEDMATEWVNRVTRALVKAGTVNQRIYVMSPEPSPS
jgi:tetratricopeptide (TPR) repeat protein/GGDEF domain-containing protein